MAKSYRSSCGSGNLEASASHCVAAVADPASVRTGVRPALRSAAKKHSADAIAIAVLFGIIVLSARNGATLWEIPHSNLRPEVAAESPAPTIDPATAREEDARRQKVEKRRLVIAQLRTEVGNILGHVEESRWSIETLDEAGPALDRLISKAKANGRSELAVFWRSLAEHLASARAAKKGDRARARVMFARAAIHLKALGHGATGTDSTLRGDVISTIGGFLGTAKVLGIEAQSPLVAELTQLRHRLKVEDAAIQQAASRIDRR